MPRPYRGGDAPAFVELILMRHSCWSTLLVAAIVVLPSTSTRGAIESRSVAQQASPAAEPGIVVGESPPTSFVLQSIDDETFGLATADRPLLLLFFRGTW